jgi:hypothetical protein
MKICGDFESFEQNKIDKLLNHNIWNLGDQVTHY